MLQYTAALRRTAARCILPRTGASAAAAASVRIATPSSVAWSLTPACATRAGAAIRPIATSTGYIPAKLDAHVYHKLVDTALDSLSAQLEELVETVDIDALEAARGSDADASDWDIEYATGVINASLGSNGTYVINKQPPSQQLWLSSPTSGPKRFDYDTEQNVWFTHKEGKLYLLHELLNDEFSQIFDTPIEVDLSGTNSHV
ncbi:ferroxidase [Malassezia cuniculi]|uniref:Ferroxidase n=1 Tax=Malassezia cuniculi TaxID=948313 RepID=A0AAF0J6B8_9BASI|nr:ferroxidase [Malassezia cuniculi]